MPKNTNKNISRPKVTVPSFAYPLFRMYIRTHADIWIWIMHRAPDPRRQQPLYTYTHTCIPLLAIQFPVITSMNCSFNTDISQRYNITARSRHSKFLAARAYTYCLSFSLSLISLPPILLSFLSRKLLRVAGSNPCSRVTAISRRGYRVRPPRSFARIFHPAAERLTVSVCMLHARGPKLLAGGTRPR